MLITICARGGSKGIPGKNIKLLNGKPLICYSIDIARRFQNIYEDVTIELSTDSDDILNTAAGCGIITDYKRPDILAGDTVGKIDVLADLLIASEKKSGKSFEYIMDLDVTSPLRTLNDLTEAYTILRNDKDAYNIFSVSPANRSPYFNMVEQKENGYFSQVVRPASQIFSRQSSPRAYDMNASFYIYRRSFFTSGCKGAITDKSLVYVVPHICFDLDDPVDFEFLEFLMGNKKLNFSL